MNKEMSPALQLLSAVWQNQGHQMKHSWRRINAIMQDVLKLAIVAGLEFFLDDFRLIARKSTDGGFNFGYWAGVNGHMLGESFYAFACRNSFGPNISACLSFEAWKNRKPFILKSSAKGRKRQRIAIGSKFDWKGQQVTCTSFSESGDNIIACSYKHTSGRRFIDERYKITFAELREHNRQHKAIK